MTTAPQVTHPAPAIDPAAPSPPARREQAAEAWARYGNLAIGIVSLIGVVLIAWILWPAGGSTPAGQTWVIDGVPGIPTHPPTRGASFREGRRVSLGDASALLRGEELVVTYADPLDDRTNTPSLIGRDDRHRANVAVRLRTSATLREQLGITEEQLAVIENSTRGLLLNVPAEEAQALRQALQQSDPDVAYLALARAANAARADFLNRTRIAVAAVRQVVTDDVLQRVGTSQE